MRTNNHSPKAERVDAIRQTLMHESNEVRLGNNLDPEETARRLTDVALELFHSEASEFEKVVTLNQTHANLLGGGVSQEALHHMAGLSFRALHIAFPTSADAYTDRMNFEEITVRLEAIDSTSPGLPFIGAYDKAWEHKGKPIEPILVQSEQFIKSALEQNRRQQVAEQATGAFSPAVDSNLPKVEAAEAQQPVPQPRSPLQRLKDSLTK